MTSSAVMTVGGAGCDSAKGMENEEEERHWKVNGSGSSTYWAEPRLTWRRLPPRPPPPSGRYEACSAFGSSGIGPRSGMPLQTLSYKPLTLDATPDWPSTFFLGSRHAHGQRAARGQGACGPSPRRRSWPRWPALAAGGPARGRVAAAARGSLKEQHMHSNKDVR